MHSVDRLIRDINRRLAEIERQERDHEAWLERLMYAQEEEQAHPPNHQPMPPDARQVANDH